MTNEEIRSKFLVVSLIDDHQSGMKGEAKMEENLLGVVTGVGSMQSILVSLGPVGYMGPISLNEIRMWRGIPHLTTRSVAVFSESWDEFWGNDGKISYYFDGKLMTVIQALPIK